MAEGTIRALATTGSIEFAWRRATGAHHFRANSIKRGNNTVQFTVEATVLIRDVFDTGCHLALNACHGIPHLSLCVISNR